MSKSSDDITQKIFSNEHLIIISPKSDMEKAMQGLKNKWLLKHPKDSVTTLTLEDFLANPGQINDEIKGNIKIYLLAHHSPSEDVVSTDEEGQHAIHYYRLAEKLAKFIGDKQVVINLVSCAAGRGQDEPNPEGAINSFAVKLHGALKSIAQRAIPIMAREQIVFVDDLSGKKTTMPVNVHYSHVEDLPSTLAKHKQARSKFIFSSNEDNELIQVDAYVAKLQQKAVDRFGNLDFEKLLNEPDIAATTLLEIIIANSRSYQHTISELLHQDSLFTQKLRNLLIEALPQEIVGYTGLEHLYQYSPSVFIALCKEPIQKNDPTITKAIITAFYKMEHHNRSGIHLLTSSSPELMVDICNLAIRNNHQELLFIIFSSISSVEYGRTGLHKLADCYPNILPQLIECGLLNDVDDLSKYHNFSKIIEALTMPLESGYTTWELFSKNSNRYKSDKILQTIFNCLDKFDNSKLETIVKMLSDTPVEHSPRLFKPDQSPKENDIKHIIREKSQSILSARISRSPD